jgi:hypothetical protein
LIVASPLMVTIMVLVKMLYVEELNGEPAEACSSKVLNR